MTIAKDHRTTLRRLWAIVLNEEEEAIQDEDVFFDLGGDSLRASELIDVAEGEGLQFTIQDLFSKPSLKDLASCVVEMEVRTPSESSKRPGVVPQTMPLTLRQAALVNGLSRSGPSGTPRTWRRAQLDIEVPVSRIRQAFDDIVRVHPMLRTTLSQETLVVGEDYRFRSFLYGNSTTKHIEDIEKESLQAVDLVNGPVFSVDLYRHDGRLYLFLVAHSLLIDETSWTIILDDLDEAIAEKKPPLQPPHGMWELCESDLKAPRELHGWTENLEEATMDHILNTFATSSGTFTSYITYTVKREPGWKRVVGKFEALLQFKVERSEDGVKKHVVKQVIGAADLVLNIGPKEEEATDSSNLKALVCVERPQVDQHKLGSMLSAPVKVNLGFMKIGQHQISAHIDDHHDNAEAMRMWIADLQNGQLLSCNGKNEKAFGMEPEQIKAIATQCNILASQIGDIYPCTPMQESLVANIDENDTNLYVRQLVFKTSLDDTLIERFKSAWRETVKANPVLRSRICHLSNGYSQVVVAADDITSAPVWQSSQHDITQFLDEDASEPMNIGDPFFRYTISTNPNGERYFVWTIHHALCDGATIPMILSEVASRYERQPSPPREPYSSFIRSLATTPDTLEEKRFWRQVLSGLTPVPYPTLPLEHGFQPDPTCHVQQLLNLDDEAPSHGLTTTLLLQSAWAILLSHYTGTDDVCFGVINSGRTAAVPGVRNMTGPTINLTPIGLHIDQTETVAAFLTRVRTRSANAMSFEHSGQSRIRRFLSGDGQSTATLDFQSLFVVHPQELEHALEPSMKALDLKYMNGVGKTEKHRFPLILSFTIQSNQVVRLDVQFDNRVLSTQLVENLVHHFQAILTQIIRSNHDTTIETITPFSNHDKAQIAEWNRVTPPAEQTCADRLFHAMVLEQPDAIAVCTMDESLTYLQVNRHSSVLARRIAALGYEPGSFVGVCFEKSIWTVVAIMAVFKAGCVYVPIDPEHPQKRIHEVVRTVNITVCLTSNYSLRVLGGLCPNLIVVDGASHTPSRADEEFQSRSIPSHIAYLLFTSGSTGKPKGILISHSAICTSIKHHGHAFGAGPHWRTLQFCAHSFDISIGEFLTTLSYGGCICVPSAEERLSNLAGCITALRANTLLVVPTVANLMFPKDVPTLKTLILGGEPVTKDIVARWADSVDLGCSYGPSECAVWSAANLRVSSDADPSNIGRSIGGTMWIVNPDIYRRLSAIGCVGEPVISGFILGQGYFGDKATTDAAFVPAPDWLISLGAASPSDKIYRTGDLARYNADGTFHIIGRRDTQVKLRGFRIELGEIENQIMAAGTEITASFAALPKAGACSGQIVAIVSLLYSGLEQHDNQNDIVMSSSQDHSAVKVAKDHLRRILPEYMIPTHWFVLKRMPLLISGKVDRKSLQMWLHSSSVVERTEKDKGNQVAPGSMAASISSLWSQVLNVPKDRIGLQTSFLSLGGDSLAAIMVVSRAKTVGLPLTVRGVISTNTLEDLAFLATTAQLAANRAASPPKSPAEAMPNILHQYHDVLHHHIRDRSDVQIQAAYGLSPIQRDILKAREANPENFLLLWQVELTSPESQPIALERLSSAWHQTVQKHDILRTIFIGTSKNLPALQVVLGNVEPDISISTASSDEDEPTLDTTQPGFLPHRALFYQHGSKVSASIQLEHTLIDGWSLGLLRATFLDAYQGDSRSNVKEALPYKEFINSLRTDRVQDDEKYWSTILQNQPPSLLSSPFPISPSKIRMAKTVLDLPNLKMQALADFSVTNGVTPASIIDAAWSQTLSLYTQSSDVTFGYIKSSRDEHIVGGLDIAGPLINILAYHLHDVSVQSDPNVLAGLAQRLQKQRGEDSEHTSCSISEVVEKHLTVEKLFNTAVNFQRRPKALENAMLRMNDDMERSKDPWHVSQSASRTRRCCVNAHL